MLLCGWSPLQLGQPIELTGLLDADPSLRGEVVDHTSGEVLPYGLDYGNPNMLAALTGPGSTTGHSLIEVANLPGTRCDRSSKSSSPHFPGGPPASRPQLGPDFPVVALFTDVGPAIPALRVACFETAVRRVEKGYTAWQKGDLDEHELLAS